MPDIEVWLDVEKALARGHEASVTRNAIRGQVMKLRA